MKRTLMVAAILLAITASGVLAQRGRSPRERGAQNGAGGSAAMMAGSRMQRVFSPHRLLQNQSALELTEDQVSQLTALSTASAAAREQGRARLVSQRAQMVEVLTADNPDPQLVRQHYDAAQSALSELGWMGIDHTLQARALLTEAQQTAARDLRAERRRGRRAAPRAGRGFRRR